MNPLEIRASFWKTMLLSVVAALLFAGSIFVLQQGEKPLVACGGILLFGGGSLIFFKKLMDIREPEFVLDEDGILIKSLRRQKIFWDEIHHFDLIWIPPHGPQMLALVLNQAGADRVFGQQSAEGFYQKWMVKKLGLGYQIMAPASGLAVSKEQFLEEIRVRHLAKSQA